MKIYRLDSVVYDRDCSVQIVCSSLVICLIKLLISSFTLSVNLLPFCQMIMPLSLYLDKNDNV